jgi:tetratricopeptide (TPR) repeat protein
VNDSPAAVQPDRPQAERQTPPGPRQEPRETEHWYQLGLQAVRQGRFAAAIEALDRAVGLDPSQAMPHHYLATSHRALGQQEQAAHHFHQVVCLKPELPEAHNNWGIALAQLKRRDEALAVFAQAVRLKPEYAEAHNNWGNTLVEHGQLDQAVEHFQEALRIHPQYPEAHNNLGLTLARLGRGDEAVTAIQKAVKLVPTYAEAHHNLGNLYRDRGSLQEALGCYRQVLKLRADHRDARQQLAVTLTRLGQLEEAIACLHQCLLFHPDNVDSYNLLGVVLSQRDRLDEAAAAFRQAFRLKPGNAEALNNLGNTLLRQQKCDEAIQCFEQALQLRQDYPQPHCNLGSALTQQGRPEEALAHYQTALRLQPDYVDAHFNLGNAYRTLGRFPEAIACFERVLQLQPDNAGARLNLGVTKSELGHLDEANAILEEALRRHPDLVQTYNSLGVNCLHQGRVHEAMAFFERGITHKPEDAEVHLNRALTLLLLGDYEPGWVEYEWRWKLKKAAICPYPQPAWDGSPLPQGTIVLWAEQGLGDTLQFARYATLVKERVGKVLLDCPGPLRGLLLSLPGIDGLAGAGTAEGPTPDVQAPLMSLPRIFGTTPTTVPASVPYLFVDGAQRETWRQKLASGGGLKVGISWQGNKHFSGDRHRSVKLKMFAPLAAIPGVQLFSLQKGYGSEQLAAWTDKILITDLGSQISADFRDTAAAMSQLDLFITVDTSVAHLAGALGIPVWILLPFNPDWRWLLDRDETAWYPSARLFRQRHWGDWEGVFQQLTQALRKRACRPLPARVTIDVGLLENLERKVLHEIRNGRSEDSLAALPQNGITDTANVHPMMQQLKMAFVQLKQLQTEMPALERAGKRGLAALHWVRHYMQAEKEHSDCLVRIAAWLIGEERPSELPPGPA